MKNIKTCDKNPDHGDYELQELDLLGKSKYIGSCPRCASERDDRDASAKARKENKNRESIRIKAGISKRNLFKTFDDYHADPGTVQEKAKKRFQLLSTEIKNNNGFNVIATGGAGTGKTLLASALIDSLINDENPSRVSIKQGRLITMMDLSREIKETYHFKAVKSEKEVIDYFANLPLLIIDEIGVQRDTDNEKLVIFDIIDGRYKNMLPTVLISNMDIDKITKLIGERVIDRLREDGGTQVVFDWDSYRKSKGDS